MRKNKPRAKNPNGVNEKVREARFFLVLMADYERSSELESFLFCLSAFLSAFRTIGNRLIGVARTEKDLEKLLEQHPRIGFLFSVRDVEVHGDGTTIWPRFRLVDARTSAPGPLELRFFPRMAGIVRVIGFHFDSHRPDQNLIEFCHDALNDMEEFIRPVIPSSRTEPQG